MSTEINHNRAVINGSIPTLKTASPVTTDQYLHTGIITFPGIFGCANQSVEITRLQIREYVITDTLQAPDLKLIFFLDKIETTTIVGGQNFNFTDITADINDIVGEPIIIAAADFNATKIGGVNKIQYAAEIPNLVAKCKTGASHTNLFAVMLSNGSVTLPGTDYTIMPTITVLR